MTERKCSLCEKKRKLSAGMFRFLVGSNFDVKIIPKKIICNKCMDIIETKIVCVLKSEPVVVNKKLINLVKKSIFCSNPVVKQIKKNGYKND